MKALTIPQIDAILSRASPPYSLMVMLQFNHAMRSSEVTGLLRSDVDLQSRTILVRRLKASKTTLQPLRDNEFASLREWLSKPSTSRYVFPGRGCLHLTRNAYYKWFRQTAELAGLPKEKRHPHCLKHSTCMFLLKNGMELVHLQTYVGHASIQSTMQYLHISQEEACDAASKVFNSLGGKN